MTDPHADSTAPTLAQIEAIAHETVAALPDAWREEAMRVALRVEDFPDEAMLGELGMDSPFELTGLYEGTPLTDRHVMDQPMQPDVIWLFRRPILDEWAERGDVTLQALVAHVTIHEFAHHFGWSDDDIAAVDRWWE